MNQALGFLSPGSYSMISVTAAGADGAATLADREALVSSIAIGVISSTSTSTLSPGMHISAPTRFAVPVTSVVRK